MFTANGTLHIAFECKLIHVFDSYEANLQSLFSNFNIKCEQVTVDLKTRFEVRRLLLAVCKSVRSLLFYSVSCHADSFTRQGERCHSGAGCSKLD